MSVRSAPGSDISQFKLNHAGTQQSQAGMNRSGKGDVQIGPAHGFRKRNLQYRFWQYLFEQGPRCLTPFLLYGAQISPFLGFFNAQLVNFNTRLLSKLFGGNGGFAGFIKPDLNRRPGQFSLKRQLFGGHIFNSNGQSAGGPEYFGGTMLNPGFSHLFL